MYIELLPSITTVLSAFCYKNVQPGITSRISDLIIKIIKQITSGSEWSFKWDG